MLTTILAGFSPFRLRNFRIYMSGQAVSLIGTWLQTTALSWVVWELSHSETSLGVVAMLASLPLLFLGPWTGVLADRLNRRKLLIATQAGLMLLAFILAALIQTGLIQIWHVYIVSLLAGTCTALDFPAQQAFLGDLAGMGEVRKAVNLNAMFLQTSRMIGPAFAGWVIGSFGAGVAFWTNGVSFMAVIGSLMVVQSHQVRRPASNRSVFGDLMEALHFLKSQARLQDLFLLTILVTFLGISVINLAPAMASEMLGGDAATLGALLSASGAGSLISALVLMPLAQARQRIGRIMGTAVIWMGVCFLILSQMHSLLPAILIMFAYSLGVPLVIATSLGLLQLLAPAEMRARLVSLFTMVSFGSQPISAIAIGAGAEKFGVPTIVLINGALLILGGLVMLFLRSGLRDWVASPSTVPPGALTH